MSRHGSDWNPRCSDSVVSQWKDEGEQARGGGGGRRTSYTFIQHLLRDLL